MKTEQKEDLNKQIEYQLALRKEMKNHGYKTWNELAKEHGISRQAVRIRIQNKELKLLRLENARLKLQETDNN